MICCKRRLSVVQSGTLSSISRLSFRYSIINALVSLIYLISPPIYAKREWISSKRFGSPPLAVRLSNCSLSYPDLRSSSSAFLRAISSEIASLATESSLSKAASSSFSCSRKGRPRQRSTPPPSAGSPPASDGSPDPARPTDETRLPSCGPPVAPTHIPHDRYPP